MGHSAEGTCVRDIVGKNRNRRYGGSGAYGIEPGKEWISDDFKDVGRGYRESNQSDCKSEF